MSSKNLAICLAPSLFRFSNLAPGGGGTTRGGAPPLLVNFSPRRRRKVDPLGGLDAKDIAEQTAAQLCLSELISEAPNLFVVSSDNSQVDQFSLVWYSA